MTLKKTLRLCLIILLCSAHSCAKIDYINESDWKYINNTDEVITVLLGDGDYLTVDSNFTLSPGEEYEFRVSAYSSTPDLTADDYRTPYFIQGATIIIGDEAPQFFPGTFSKEYTGTLNSICNVENYTAEKLGTNYFRFTYVFEP